LIVCLVAWQAATFPWSRGGSGVLAGVVALAGGVVGVAAVVEFALEGAEASVRMAHPNRLAAFLLMTWPVAFAWGRARPWGARRVGAMVAGLAMLAGMAVTFSRGGWLGVVAQGLYVCPRHRGRFLAVAALLLVVVWVALPWETTGLVRTLAPGYATNVSRLTEWAEALRLVGEEPVWGVGVGNYARAAGTGALLPHNLFLDIAAEMGLVGLCLCMGLFSTVWRYLLWHTDEAHSRWAVAAQVAMVGLMAQGLVDY